LPLEGDRKPSLVLERGITAGKLSPDGRWLAYVSNESGTLQVYVVPFGGGQGKWQVSANGGIQPEWSKDGKELFYMDLTFNLLAVPVTNTGGALQFGVAEKLVDQLVRSAGLLRCLARRQEISSRPGCTTGQPIGHGGYELYGGAEEISETDSCVETSAFISTLASQVRLRHA
jgi:hypothetical protein